MNGEGLAKEKQRRARSWERGEDRLPAEGHLETLDMGKQQRRQSGAAVNRFLSSNWSATSDQVGRGDDEELKS